MEQKIRAEFRSLISELDHRSVPDVEIRQSQVVGWYLSTTPRNVMGGMQFFLTRDLTLFQGGSLEGVQVAKPRGFGQKPPRAAATATARGHFQELPYRGTVPWDMSNYSWFGRRPGIYLKVDSTRPVSDFLAEEDRLIISAGNRGPLRSLLRSAVARALEHPKEFW